MEMSVPVGGDSKTVEQPKSPSAQDRRNSSDLDVWLEKAEAMGELKRITAEVSCELEAAHITYLVGLEKSPALLFENIKGHPGHKALYGPTGTGALYVGPRARLRCWREGGTGGDSKKEVQPDELVARFSQHFDLR